MSTQRYDVLSDRIRNRFIRIILVELDRIRNLYCNVYRLIIFQTIVLQRARLVLGSISICDRISSRLDLWNKGDFEDLVQDSYRSVEVFLGNNRGNQT